MDQLAADVWFKELAPSSEVRKWFNHQPENWPVFVSAYFDELKQKHEVIEGWLLNWGVKTALLFYMQSETVIIIMRCIA